MSPKVANEGGAAAYMNLLDPTTLECPAAGRTSDLGGGWPRSGRAGEKGRNRPRSKWGLERPSGADIVLAASFQDAFSVDR